MTAFLRHSHYTLILKLYYYSGTKSYVNKELLTIPGRHLNLIKLRPSWQLILPLDKEAISWTSTGFLLKAAFLCSPKTFHKYPSVSIHNLWVYYGSCSWKRDNIGKGKFYWCNETINIIATVDSFLDWIRD